MEQNARKYEGHRRYDAESDDLTPWQYQFSFTGNLRGQQGAGVNPRCRLCHHRMARDYGDNQDPRCECEELPRKRNHHCNTDNRKRKDEHQASLCEQFPPRQSRIR